MAEDPATKQCVRLGWPELLVRASCTTLIALSSTCFVVAALDVDDVPGRIAVILGAIVFAFADLFLLIQLLLELMPKQWPKLGFIPWVVPHRLSRGEWWGIGVVSSVPVAMGTFGLLWNPVPNVYVRLVSSLTCFWFGIHLVVWALAGHCARRRA